MLMVFMSCYNFGQARVGGEQNRRDPKCGIASRRRPLHQTVNQALHADN